MTFVIPQPKQWIYGFTDPSASISQALGLQVCATTTVYPMWGQSPGLWACQANALPTEPQSLIFLFWVKKTKVQRGLKV